ncbi:CHASE2 domain-containing protein [Scytonema sp. UIC 10036]|uniref:CHASE2 domain-containing protein n=1 Tax=Scytonema sp. UIC 10036 TaxID=2304196 RepID=UPI0012DAC505|nr:CHASE2 domain-containing protein [Scytonema sp. UIC 10036]MUG92205.1 CHASE2 domain-containing protein [Scytonema sp. UIC 10036]
MAGVFIHANITSQRLTAALQGRGMLRTWSETWESLWILFWSGIGALVSWRLKLPRQASNSLLVEPPPIPLWESFIIRPV